MATISISRKHKKSLADARSAIERVASGLARKFQLDHEWKGQTLHFSRSGVDGHIALGKGVVRVEVNLGFLLMMLRASVEEEIERYLDQEFG